VARNVVAAIVLGVVFFCAVALDVDPDKSVWAATGFGVFSDDLVRRILRGDRHRHRP
jgi:hypothetical protein